MPIYNYEGWTPDYDEIDRLVSDLEFKSFGEAAPHLTDDGIGETNLLYRALVNVRGSWPRYVQLIGDCVGMGFSRAVMILSAVEILSGERELYAGDIPSEDIYAGARIEIGRGQLGNSDGAVGAWAAEYIKQYGTLLRKVYGSIDLRQYDGNRARNWGNRGVPDELEQYSREHTVGLYTPINSYEEARSAINNGYPIAVCSSQGFRDIRDTLGYGIPNGKWMHCMVFCGCHDGSKPALVCDNTSWPESWISGPKPEWAEDMPEGMFPVHAEIADRMLRQGDSYAISNFNGYKKRKVQFENLLL